MATSGSMFMSRQTISSVAALGLIFGAHHASAVTHDDLAFHYAPVHYQDTDSSDYPSDYVTAFDSVRVDARRFVAAKG